MKLNLGVGRDALDGWVNVDIKQYTGVNVIWNLNIVPWPFENEQFDEILALDILEHVVDLTAVMDECWRILQPGGEITIRGPVAGELNHFADPTHLRGFMARSFNYYAANMQPGVEVPLIYGEGRWELTFAHKENLNIWFKLTRLA